MLKWLWNRYKQKFLKFHYEDTYGKFSLKDLEHGFVDKNGTAYLRFPDGKALTMDRLGKLLEYNMFMSAGINKEELLPILDRMDQYVTDGLKNKSNAAKLAFLIEELRQRTQIVIHEELLCNMLAVQYVRSDEDPLLFNNQIHMEKVSAIKEEIAEGNNYFFSEAPELKRLMKQLNITESELRTLWAESQVVIRAHQKMLKTFLSPTAFS